MSGNVRDASWVGDAVLALCARNWIIAHEHELGSPRHDLFRDMTSNSFLATFGPPTEVEADLGRIFAQQGLEAAHRYFEERFVPVFIKQQRNRNAAAKRR